MVYQAGYGGSGILRQQNEVAKTSSPLNAGDNARNISKFFRVFWSVSSGRKRLPHALVCRRLCRPGDADQMAFRVREVADHEICSRVFFGAHSTRPAGSSPMISKCTIGCPIRLACGLGHWRVIGFEGTGTLWHFPFQCAVNGLLVALNLR